MKKLILLALVICAGFNLKAQKKPIQQTNHHEIGVDASPFLAQILPGNGYNNSIPYSFMYRYHFKKSAIRAGIGGLATKNENTLNDTTLSRQKISRFQFRIGYERKSDFGKHWQFYYGIDGRFQLYKTEYYDEFTQARSRISTLENTYYGVAPLMGFRFKINDRISVTTETSFLIAYYTSKSTYEWTPVVPPYHNKDKQNGEGYEASFNEPINIVFTYNF